MSKDLLHGDLVRLVVEDPETMAKHLSRWSRDSWYWRLMALNAALPHSVKSTQEWLEKQGSDNYMFMIRTLVDDRLVGEIGLDGIRWAHGDTFVGISIGDRADWGKGYGTDAMRILLRYVFNELNLHRVSLTVFEYNLRAIRSYEKAGFTMEGRARQIMLRDRQRYDVLFMGILRQEWLAQQAA